MRLFEIDFYLRSVQNTLDYRIQCVKMNSNECSKLFVEDRYYIENFKKLNFDKLKQISNLQINTHICSESSGGDRRKNSIPENNFNACVHMTVN